MKCIISVACLLLVAAAAIEAKPQILYAAAPAVAVSSVPVVRTGTHLEHHPTTVVKTEQVHDAHHGNSYSYSTEVKSHPHVVAHQTVTHQAVATPVVAAAPVAAVSTLHHTVPAYTYSHYNYPLTGYGYGSYGGSYYPGYYSPYSYVLGK